MQVLLSKCAAVYTFGKVTVNGVEYTRINKEGSNEFVKSSDLTATKPDTTVPSQSKTIMHNAYVYKSSKKRANKVTLKKGTEVTTYGGTYTFKNGKQYYKIGNNTDKTYVKASNF